MNKANFLNFVRFIADSETWDFMQQMTHLVSNLALLGGKNYILSGCEVTGSSVSAGIVVVNGEIMPFAGGTLAENVIINETTESVQYEDIINENLYIYHTAIFGTSTPSYKWADFVRINNLTDLTNHIADKNNPHRVNKEQVGLGNLPNAKSDAINLDDSESLATSKAVKLLADLLPLASGTYKIGDLYNPTTFTVRFGNIGTTDYIVIGSWRSNGAAGADAQMLGWVWHNPTKSSFDITISEYGSGVQNVTFCYAVLKTT